MRGQASNTVQQGKHWIGHQAQQVKQATNNILEKEIPLTQPKVAIAGAGSVQVGKGVTLREASQNIQRTYTPNHQVTHIPKNSMVKSEGNQIKASVNKSKNYSKEKPKNSPNKWLKKGGEIKVDENGTWIYTNKDGIKVAYRNGYPDFKGAGLVEQEVDINSFDSYYTDFKKADKLAERKKRIENTWHYHED